MFSGNLKISRISSTPALLALLVTVAVVFSGCEATFKNATKTPVVAAPRAPAAAVAANFAFSASEVSGAAPLGTSTSYNVVAGSVSAAHGSLGTSASFTVRGGLNGRLSQ